MDCLFELSPRRTDPSFAELIVVADGLIFARKRGEPSFGYFVGRRDDLIVNLLGFVTHLRLGTSDRLYVLDCIDAIPRRGAA